MKVRRETLLELPRLFVDSELRRRFFDRYATSSECHPALREIARRFQRAGIGVLTLPCGECDASPPPVTILERENVLTFVDELGPGRLTIGWPTKVYRFAPALDKYVEWRRWQGGCKLEPHCGTELLRFRDGWLTFAHAVSAESRSPLFHRFLFFGPEFDLRALSSPWQLPPGAQARATHLWTDTDDLFIEVVEPESARKSTYRLPLELVESWLLPGPAARLELPGPEELYNLRFIGPPVSSGEK